MINWKNETAIVTGACGFIGSHLVEALIRLKADVTALVFYQAQGSNGWMDNLPPAMKKRVRIVRGDVRDSEQMLDLVQPGSHVFHLAALIGIPYSYAAPRSYLDTNLYGTLNLLEAARRQRAKRLLVVSTSEVYGTALTVPISESHPLQAQSPYAASKIAAEKLAESYICSFGLPITIIRPFNTYGPRQSPRAVIPTILMQLAGGKRFLSLGDTRTTRDFNFVTDTVNGMIQVAACPKAAGETVNLGTGIEYRIDTVAYTAARLLQQSIRIRSVKQRQRPIASEVRRLLADASHLHCLTGWKPSISLETGLRITLKWMLSHHHEYDPSRYYV